jgi:hypothetical protein
VPWKLGDGLKCFFSGEYYLKLLVGVDDNVNIFSRQPCETKKWRAAKNTE